MEALIPMLIALIAIFAVIYLAYIFTKYLSVSAGKMSGAKYMRVVDRLMMGQDKMLAIVQIGPTYYLAGITEQNVQILKELEEEELIAMAVPAESFANTVTGTFKETFGKHMGKKEDL